jgi:hypothetical protein
MSEYDCIDHEWLEECPKCGRDYAAQETAPECPECSSGEEEDE